MKLPPMVCFLWMLAGCALAAGDAPGSPAVVLNLNGAITDPDQIDFEHLPRIEGISQSHRRSGARRQPGGSKEIIRWRSE